MNPKYKTIGISIPVDLYDDIYKSYEEYLVEHKIDKKILSFSRFCVLMLVKSIK